MGNFNTKLGKKQESDEEYVGALGYGERNGQWTPSLKKDQTVNGLGWVYSHR